MAQNGREFERLIEKLEKLLAGSDVEIVRNARLIDKRTGGEREIDILLTAKIGGSHTINIILECRNRKAPPDVRWIDELATKRDAVGAHKAVVISSIPLTKEALKAAEVENIAVRTVGKINIAEVSQWFQAKTITVVQPHPKVKNVRIQVCGSGETNEEHKKLLELKLIEILNNGSKPYLLDRNTKKHHSMSALWREHIRIPGEVIRRLESLPTGTVEHVVFKLNIGRNILEIIDMKGSFVCEIFFDVEVTVEIKEYLPNEVLKYAENKDTLSEIVRFNLEIDGENVDVDIIRNPKGFNFTTSKPANFSVTYEIKQSP